MTRSAESARTAQTKTVSRAAVGETAGLRRSRLTLAAWWFASLVALAAVVVASLAIGSRSLGSEPIGFGTVVQSLLSAENTEARRVVVGLRLPRTLLGLLVGAAFGVAGALIQAFTRNPLADPGILGVNAGAAFAVTLGVALAGVTNINQYLVFAFIGAAVATVLVYAIASGGRGGATPLRLTLVGMALSAVLAGFSQVLALMDSETFDRMRFWGAGTIANRPDGTIGAVLWFIVGGLLIALLSARSLNALALGDHQARALGVRVGRVRTLCVLAVTLLCGAATAAVGPIGFIGLMVPHAVRWLTGPDQRRILAFTMLYAPMLMLIADIVGRLLVFPGELQVGIVTAFIGAPVLMILVRRKRASAL